MTKYTQRETLKNSQLNSLLKLVNLQKSSVILFEIYTRRFVLQRRRCRRMFYIAFGCYYYDVVGSDCNSHCLIHNTRSRTRRANNIRWVTFFCFTEKWCEILLCVRRLIDSANDFFPVKKNQKKKKVDFCKSSSVNRRSFVLSFHTRGSERKKFIFNNY